MQDSQRERRERSCSSNSSSTQFSDLFLSFSAIMEMMKMVWLFHLFFLFFLGLTVTGAAAAGGQESYELINLYDSTPPMLHTNVPIAVSVSHADLKEVSSSLLMAETWLRTHVLAHYPATKISTIVVGDTVLCNTNQGDKLGMVLPCIKNLYHSLTRWGLERDIKVSAAFSSDCLHSYSAKYTHDLAENVIKPLLYFLQTTNSTYSVNPPPDFSLLHDSLSLVSSHSDSIKKLGFFGVYNKVNLLIRSTNERNPMMSRKLSFMDSKVVEPYPARPTPLPEISPMHSSIGYSVPANIAKKPLPPQASTALPPSLSYPIAPELSPPSLSYPIAPELSPPSLSFPVAPELSPPSMSSPFAPHLPPPSVSSPSPFAPERSPPSMSPPFVPELPPPSMSPPFVPVLPPPSMSPPFVPVLPPPFINPANPPFGYTLPPCNPSYTGGPIAPAPSKTGVEQELWCVAKPTVPAETLQEAMDYACGAGGADCEEIRPQGSCYNPDIIVAHASFAFNSYWQKNKRNGGTCNFGGTAMIINSDPSFLHCRFVLS